MRRWLAVVAAWAARAARGLWPDRNPLRRRLDRAEAAIAGALAVAFLAGAPLTAVTVWRLAVTRPTAAAGCGPRGPGIPGPAANLGWPDMDNDRVLAAVSAAQLACGVGGMVLALRRGHAFDVGFWRGQESAIGRDTVLSGTALSAPTVMLGAQAGAITVLLRRPSRGARWLLGGLGAAMVPGYAWERLVRQRLIPAGWDTAESPVILAGIGLAAAMAVIGLRPARS